MTEMEWVWSRIKERAAAYAASGSLVSMSEARIVTLSIYVEECPDRLPSEAAEFLVRELVRLTIEANAKQGVRY